MQKRQGIMLALSLILALIAVGLAVASYMSQQQWETKHRVLNEMPKDVEAAKQSAPAPAPAPDQKPTFTPEPVIIQPNAVPPDVEEMQPIKRTTGVYVGRIDPSFIEITVEDKSTVFYAPMGRFSDNDFIQQDKVMIDFFTNQYNQLELVVIKSIAPPDTE